MGPGMISAARRRSAGGAGPTFDFPNSKLLLGFNGTNGSTTIPDESAAARGNASVFSGAAISTAQQKFGTGSLALNGTSDYISFAQNADFNFGTGAFTVGMFVRFTSVASSIAFIGNRDGSGVGWRFTRENGNLQFNAAAGGTVGAGWTPTTGQWYHIMADRGANVCRTYVDGVMLQNSGAGSPGSIGNSTLGPFIGRLPSVGIWFHAGHMDEVFVIKGAALCASDAGFTVPASAYPRS